MRVIFKKLVRDRIPEIIERRGKTCVVSELAPDDYLRELKSKLLEEAQEARVASGIAELTLELADLLEVIVSLCEASGISMTAVEETRMIRATERGRFERRLFLEEVGSLDQEGCGRGEKDRT